MGGGRGCRGLCGQAGRKEGTPAQTCHKATQSKHTNSSEQWRAGCRRATWRGDAHTCRKSHTHRVIIQKEARRGYWYMCGVQWHTTGGKWPSRCQNCAAGEGRLELTLRLAPKWKQAVRDGACKESLPVVRSQCCGHRQPRSTPQRQRRPQALHRPPVLGLSRVLCLLRLAVPTGSGAHAASSACHHRVPHFCGNGPRRL